MSGLRHAYDAAATATTQFDACQLSAASRKGYKFTGKERDTESGLDDFGARYNASTLGRFLQTDPVWVEPDRVVDPQRLNLYEYGRNNPLEFVDSTGRDIKMGSCPSSMTTSMCEAAVTDGVNKADRSHIHFVEGNGANGFDKGEVGIKVDKDYKSNSGNFNTLQTLANDHGGTAVLNVAAPNERFPIVTVTGFSSKTGMTFANSTASLGHLQDPVAFHGLTFFSLTGSAYSELARYTPLPFTEVYVNSQDRAIELAADVAHELRHVKLGDFGRKPAAGAHGNPEVEKQTKEAEDEAKKNASQ
jgi:RHS repeat-associated protein